ncbi:MAG TPA: protein-methionine-sulfoxide reductase catalytic subunit MsrP [Candidatus Saccharimonadales bacterium]|jgi:sulfoxide reductase catalytic subunit YedY|nr:protein-methionine-sulfoxide reductase catalytic subunit MsrP [Candidatus Saccharimonadales bacterium]
MLLGKNPDLTYADVTPKSVYLDRRKFLKAMGVAGAVAVGGPRVWDLVSPSNLVFAATKFEGLAKSQYSTNEKQNTFQDVTHYNNFYEFGTEKTDPAKNAVNFRTTPWSVSVEGDVAKPRKFTMDEILKIAPLEERIYRHRCVEAWSIVVPWIGFSFSALARLVEPTAKAKYVAFTSYFDLGQMPQARYAGIDFPYVEGLRLDEAMNPLALLCVGMYGETLANQDGAPVRMILPWKYGFKSIKSLVKIRFQEKQPPSTWNILAPNEYGFYSNVNPTVDHPRWTQSKERRLGEIFKRNTLMFNGYSDIVAGMYSGMDLKKNY